MGITAPGGGETLRSIWCDMARGGRSPWRWCVFQSWFGLFWVFQSVAAAGPPPARRDRPFTCSRSTRFQRDLPGLCSTPAAQQRVMAAGSASVQTTNGNTMGRERGCCLSIVATSVMEASALG